MSYQEPDDSNLLIEETCVGNDYESLSYFHIVPYDEDTRSQSWEWAKQCDENGLDMDQQEEEWSRVREAFNQSV